MTEKCELLDNCPFFEQYCNNNEVIKEGWIAFFCESKEKSENCERKKYKKMYGKPPAVNMTPTGKFI